LLVAVRGAGVVNFFTTHAPHHSAKQTSNKQTFLVCLQGIKIFFSLHCTDWKKTNKNKNKKSKN
jgi:hypothetical protein